VRALMISADGFEDLELLVPYYRLKEAGVELELASMHTGEIQGLHGYKVRVDLSLEEVDPSAYDLLVLPGGRAPQAVRREEAALRIARHFFEEGKPVAAICHGPQTLISAGLMRGRRATSYPAVGRELEEAGAVYEDAEVVVDGNLVTARVPGDLPAFLREMMRFVPGRA
jgi:protease I